MPPPGVPEGDENLIGVEFRADVQNAAPRQWLAVCCEMTFEKDLFHLFPIRKNQRQVAGHVLFH